MPLSIQNAAYEPERQTGDERVWLPMKEQAGAETTDGNQDTHYA
jgi:hypothetical protein